MLLNGSCCWCCCCAAAVVILVVAAAVVAAAKSTFAAASAAAELEVKVGKYEKTEVKYKEIFFPQVEMGKVFLPRNQAI